MLLSSMKRLIIKLANTLPVDPPYNKYKLKPYILANILHYVLDWEAEDIFYFDGEYEKSALFDYTYNVRNRYRLSGKSYIGARLDAIEVFLLDTYNNKEFRLKFHVNVTGGVNKHSYLIPFKYEIDTTF